MLRSIKYQYLFLLRYAVNIHRQRVPWNGNGCFHPVASASTRTVRAFVTMCMSAPFSERSSELFEMPALASPQAVIHSDIPLPLSSCAVEAISAPCKLCWAMPMFEPRKFIRMFLDKVLPVSRVRWVSRTSLALNTLPPYPERLGIGTERIAKSKIFCLDFK